MNIRGSLKSRGGLRRHVVALLVGVLLGGGLMVVTPAGATVQQAAATNWARIWKTKLRPLADKRYARKGASYTKAQSDARYLAKPKVMRGMYSAVYHAAGAGEWGGTSINFPVTLASAPEVHFIAAGGGMLPPGCSGTAAAPAAAPGHLCIFERYELRRSFANAYGSDGFPGSDATGVSVSFTSTGAGSVVSSGTWALGVGGLGSTSARSELDTRTRPGAPAGVTR